MWDWLEQHDPELFAFMAQELPGAKIRAWQGMSAKSWADEPSFIQSLYKEAKDLGYRPLQGAGAIPATSTQPQMLSRAGPAFYTPEDPDLATEEWLGQVLSKSPGMQGWTSRRVPHKEFQEATIGMGGVGGAAALARTEEKEILHTGMSKGTAAHEVGHIAHRVLSPEQAQQAETLAWKIANTRIPGAHRTPYIVDVMLGGDLTWASNQRFVAGEVIAETFAGLMGMEQSRQKGRVLAKHGGEPYRELQELLGTSLLGKAPPTTRPQMMEARIPPTAQYQAGTAAWDAAMWPSPASGPAPAAKQQQTRQRERQITIARFMSWGATQRELEQILQTRGLEDASPREIENTLNAYFRSRYGGEPPRGRGEPMTRWQRVYTPSGKIAREAGTIYPRRGERKPPPEQWPRPGLPEEKRVPGWPVPTTEGESLVTRQGGAGMFPISAIMGTWAGIAGKTPGTIAMYQDPGDPRGAIKASKRIQASMQHEVVTMRRGQQGESIMKQAPVRVGPKSKRYDVGYPVKMAMLLEEWLPEGQMMLPHGLYTEVTQRQYKETFLPEGFDVEEAMKANVLGSKEMMWMAGERIVPFEGASPMDMGLGRQWTKARMIDWFPTPETKKRGGRQVKGQMLRMQFEMSTDPEHARLSMKTLFGKHTSPMGDASQIHGLKGYGITEIKDPTMLPAAYWFNQPIESWVEALGDPAELIRSRGWGHYSRTLTKKFQEKIESGELYDERELRFRVHESWLGHLPEGRFTATPTKENPEFYDVVTEPVPMLVGEWFAAPRMEAPVRDPNLPFRELEALQRVAPGTHEEVMEYARPIQEAYTGLMLAAMVGEGYSEAPMGGTPGWKEPITPSLGEVQGVLVRAEQKLMKLPGVSQASDIPPKMLARAILDEAATEWGDQPIRLGDTSGILAAPKYIRRFTAEGVFAGEETSGYGLASAEAIQAMVGGDPETVAGIFNRVRERQLGLATGAEFFKKSRRAMLGPRGHGDVAYAEPLLKPHEISVPVERVLQAYGVGRKERSAFISQWKAGKLTPTAMVWGHPSPGDEPFTQLMSAVHPETITKRARGAVEMSKGAPFRLNELLAEALGRDFDADLLWALFTGDLAREGGGFRIDQPKGDEGVSMATAESVAKMAKRRLTAGRSYLGRGKEMKPPPGIDPETWAGLSGKEKFLAMVNPDYAEDVSGEQLTSAMNWTARMQGRIGVYYNLLEDVMQVSQEQGDLGAGQFLFEMVHGRTQTPGMLPGALQTVMSTLAGYTQGKPGGYGYWEKFGEGIGGPGKEGKWIKAPAAGLGGLQQMLVPTLMSATGFFEGADAEKTWQDMVTRLAFPKKQRGEATELVSKWRQASPKEKQGLSTEWLKMAGLESEGKGIDTPLMRTAAAHMLHRVEAKGRTVTSIPDEQKEELRALYASFASRRELFGEWVNVGGGTEFVAPPERLNDAFSTQGDTERGRQLTVRDEPRPDILITKDQRELIETMDRRGISSGTIQAIIEDPTRLAGSVMNILNRQGMMEKPEEFSFSGQEMGIMEAWNKISPEARHALGEKFARQRKGEITAASAAWRAMHPLEAAALEPYRARPLPEPKTMSLRELAFEHWGSLRAEPPERRIGPGSQGDTERARLIQEARNLKLMRSLEQTGVATAIPQEEQEAIAAQVATEASPYIPPEEPEWGPGPTMAQTFGQPVAPARPQVGQVQQAIRLLQEVGVPVGGQAQGPGAQELMEQSRKLANVMNISEEEFLGKFAAYEQEMEPWMAMREAGQGQPPTKEFIRYTGEQAARQKAMTRATMREFGRESTQVQQQRAAGLLGAPGAQMVTETQRGIDLWKAEQSREAAMVSMGMAPQPEAESVLGSLTQRFKELDITTTDLSKTFEEAKNREEQIIQEMAAKPGARRMAELETQWGEIGQARRGLALAPGLMEEMKPGARQAFYQMRQEALGEAGQPPSGMGRIFGKRGVLGEGGPFGGGDRFMNQLLGWRGLMRMQRLWGMTGGVAMGAIPTAAGQEMGAMQAAAVGTPMGQPMMGGMPMDLLTYQANQQRFKGQMGRAAYGAWGWTQQGATGGGLATAAGIGLPALGAGMIGGTAASLAGLSATGVGIPLALLAAGVGGFQYTREALSDEDRMAIALTQGPGSPDYEIAAMQAGVGGGGVTAGGIYMPRAPEGREAGMRRLGGRLTTGNLADLTGGERVSAMQYASGLMPGFEGWRPQWMAPEQAMGGAQAWMQYGMPGGEDIRAIYENPLFAAMAERGIAPEQLGARAAEWGMGPMGAGRMMEMQAGPTGPEAMQRDWIAEQWRFLTQGDRTGEEVYGMAMEGQLQPLTGLQQVQGRAAGGVAQAAQMAGVQFQPLPTTGAGVEQWYQTQLPGVQAMTGLQQQLWGAGAEWGGAGAAAQRMGQVAGGPQAMQRLMQGDQWTMARMQQEPGLKDAFRDALMEAIPSGPVRDTLMDAFEQLQPTVDIETGLRMGVAGMPGMAGILEGWQAGLPDVYRGGRRGEGRATQIAEQFGVRGIQAEQRELQEQYQDWQFGERGRALQMQRVSQFGGTFEGFQTRGSFAIQRELRNLGTMWEEWMMDWREASHDLQRQQFMENWQVRAERMPTQFQWQREDLAFRGAQQTMQYGWGQEDIQERLRYATGRERRGLMRQQQRQTVQYAMGMGQLETQEERLGIREQWAREDLEREKRHFLERWNMQDEYNQHYRSNWEQRKALQEELQRISEQNAMFSLEQAEARLQKDIELAENLRALQDQYLAITTHMENIAAAAQVFVNTLGPALATWVSTVQQVGARGGQYQSLPSEVGANYEGRIHYRRPPGTENIPIGSWPGAGH